MKDNFEDANIWILTDNIYKPHEQVVIEEAANNNSSNGPEIKDTTQNSVSIKETHSNMEKRSNAYTRWATKGKKRNTFEALIKNKGNIVQMPLKRTIPFNPIMGYGNAIKRPRIDDRVKSLADSNKKQLLPVIINCSSQEPCSQNNVATHTRTVRSTNHHQASPQNNTKYTRPTNSASQLFWPKKRSVEPAIPDRSNLEEDANESSINIIEINDNDDQPSSEIISHGIAQFFANNHQLPHQDNEHLHQVNLHQNISASEKNPIPIRVSFPTQSITNAQFARPNLSNSRSQQLSQDSKLSYYKKQYPPRITRATSTPIKIQLTDRLPKQPYQPQTSVSSRTTTTRRQQVHNNDGDGQQVYCPIHVLSSSSRIDKRDSQLTRPTNDSNNSTVSPNYELRHPQTQRFLPGKTVAIDGNIQRTRFQKCTKITPLADQEHIQPTMNTPIVGQHFSTSENLPGQILEPSNQPVAQNKNSIIKEQRVYHANEPLSAIYVDSGTRSDKKMSRGKIPVEKYYDGETTRVEQNEEYASTINAMAKCLLVNKLHTLLKNVDLTEPNIDVIFDNVKNKCVKNIEHLKTTILNKQKEHCEANIETANKGAASLPSHHNDGENDDNNNTCNDNCDDENVKALKNKSLRQFTLPQGYDPNNTRWTLKYPNPGPGVAELLPNSRVYVQITGFQQCELKAVDCKSLARLVLQEIFSRDALSVCSLTGTRPKYAYDLEEKYVRPGLDENARIVLLKFVEKYGASKNWTFHKQSILSNIRSCMYDLRTKSILNMT